MTIRQRMAKSKIVGELSRQMYRMMARVHPKWNCERRFFKAFNRPIDWENPKTIDEKIMWLKRFYYPKSELIRRVVDKYLVLDYVRECGCGGIIKECYGAWDSVEDIPFDALPDAFALKITAGCGSHIFCRDKSRLDIERIKKTLRKNMKKKDYLDFAEMQMVPLRQRVMCERLIKTPPGLMPVDIKIHCFHGEPLQIMYCYDRDETGFARFLFADADWNMEPGYTTNKTDSPPPRPRSLDRMLDYARKLAKPFPFVRVDFFEEEGEPVFGELTFTPCGGTIYYLSEEGHRELGKFLDISRVDLENVP